MADTAGIQSLERAFSILEALSLQPGGMQLTELTALTGLHKSTVHRMLASLIGLGYVKKAEDSKYLLTLKLFELAGRVVEHIDVLEVSRLSLEKLQAFAGEAVHLVVREGSHIVYVHKSEGRAGAYQMFSRIGMRRPLYCTAAGKSILATLSDREVARIWARSEITRFTDHTLTDLDSLYRELDEARERGYALDNEENELGVRCIGAAILDYTGQSRSAFSLSAPIARMTGDRIRELAPVVLETAAKISAELGYKGESQ